MGGNGRKNPVLTGSEGLVTWPRRSRHEMAKHRTLTESIVPRSRKAGPAVSVPRRICSEPRTIRNRSEWSRCIHGGWWTSGDEAGRLSFKVWGTTGERVWQPKKVTGIRWTCLGFRKWRAVVGAKNNDHRNRGCWLRIERSTPRLRYRTRWIVSVTCFVSVEAC